MPRLCTRPPPGCSSAHLIQWETLNHPRTSDNGPTTTTPVVVAKHGCSCVLSAYFSTISFPYSFGRLHLASQQASEALTRSVFSAAVPVQRICTKPWRDGCITRSNTLKRRSLTTVCGRSPPHAYNCDDPERDSSADDVDPAGRYN